jgi:uncharacterized protein YegP (UPF0339 family)
MLNSVLSLSLCLSALSFGAGCAAEDEDDSLESVSCVDAKCDGNSSAGFEVFKGQDARYYFHLVATNGKIALRSQSYSSKASAKKGVESVRLNGLDAESYELLEASSGEYYFNLKAGNGEVIASSETYTRKFNALRGMRSAMELIADAQKARAAATGGAKFITFRGEDNQYYFHVRAANGEIVLQSEGYAAPGGMQNAIDSVRENAKVKARFEVLPAADGQYYFHLLAGNGAIIARGQTYASKSNASRAVTGLVALFQSGLVADPKTLPRVPSRSITDIPDLANQLDEIANATPENRYFGYAEGVGTPSGADCSEMDATEAASQFSDNVQLDGELRQENIDLFGQYLGSDSYKFCTVSVQDVLGASDTQYFLLSTHSGGPKFMFEVASVDD